MTVRFSPQVTVKESSVVHWEVANVWKDGKGTVRFPTEATSRSRLTKRRASRIPTQEARVGITCTHLTQEVAIRRVVAVAEASLKIACVERWDRGYRETANET